MDGYGHEGNLCRQLWIATMIGVLSSDETAKLLWIRDTATGLNGGELQEKTAFEWDSGGKTFSPRPLDWQLLL
jgi:hypothetical protein